MLNLTLSCTNEQKVCLFLTNIRRSHDHSVLVVGQPRDAVGVLGRPEVKHVPDVLSVVDHWFGSLEAIGSQFIIHNLPYRFVT